RMAWDNATSYAPGAKCLTGERPLFVYAADSIAVDKCRFEGNRMGGALLDTSGGFASATARSWATH
ncbi:hypothetical protein HYH03_019152, partial [Edaphochlamys debaryana]